MKNPFRRLLGGVALLVLAGCTNPAKPDIATVDASLPFNKAMEAAIQQDEFLTETLRPGFHRATDGSTESYTLSPDEEGGVTADHLVLLTTDWCTQSGGKVEAFAEIPVLQRGVGNVVQQGENIPVVGNAYNLVCRNGKTALAAAAIGRTTYFLSAAQFREAIRQAGASIMEKKLVR